MANVRVKVNRTTIGVEVLRRVASDNPEVKEQLRRHFSKYQGKVLSDEVGRHYKHVFIEATKVALNGLPGTEQGASHKVSINLGNGILSVPLGAWEALTRKYRQAKSLEHPGSENVFWSKRGFSKAGAPKPVIRNADGVRSSNPRKVPNNGLPTTASTLTSALRQLGSGMRGNPGQLRDVKIGGKKNNLGQVPLTAKISLRSTGSTMLDFIAGRSFMRRRPVWEFTPPGTKVEGADDAGIVIAATDQRRPLISRLAAALGQRAVIALSNMKI